MKCVILAAGEGTRLARGNMLPKPLVPLWGQPLIERAIRTAARAGLRDFVVVTGYEAERVTRFLKQLERHLAIRIQTTTNPNWQQENGLSLLQAESQVNNKDFILLMADHVVDEHIIVNLLERRGELTGCCLAVDYGVDTNELVDVDDVTKVQVRKGKIVSIGKKLPSYNGYDTGVFLCSSQIFATIRESSESRQDSTLSGAVRILAERQAATAINSEGRLWVDVDDSAQHQHAKRGDSAKCGGQARRRLGGTPLESASFESSVHTAIAMDLAWLHSQPSFGRELLRRSRECNCLLVWLAVCGRPFATYVQRDRRL